MTVFREDYCYEIPDEYFDPKGMDLFHGNVRERWQRIFQGAPCRILRRGQKSQEELWSLVPSANNGTAKRYRGYPEWMKTIIGHET